MSPAMRARCPLLLVFLAYVVLDLSSPLVPGAFCFDPDGSVDALSACRTRLAAPARIAGLPSAHVGIGIALVSRDSRTWVSPPAPSPVGWRSHAVHDLAVAAPDPSSPIEDD
jgi:hypothetical protein